MISANLRTTVKYQQVERRTLTNEDSRVLCIALDLLECSQTAPKHVENLLLASLLFDFKSSICFAFDKRIG